VVIIGLLNIASLKAGLEISTNTEKIWFELNPIQLFTDGSCQKVFFFFYFNSNIKKIFSDLSYVCVDFLG